MAQLRRHHARFEELGANVLLVGMGTPAECAEFKRRFAVPFPMAADPERRLYADFALRSMPPWKMLSPALALKGVAAIARGHGAGMPVGDVRQLPGVFIIDRRGVIVFSRPADDPSGHPAPEELFAVLERLGRTS